MAQICRDDGLMTLGRQHSVERAQEVWCCVDQCSVEVENDGERHIRHGWRSVLSGSAIVPVG
jgi:hypothetical protein